MRAGRSQERRSPISSATGSSREAAGIHTGNGNTARFGSGGCLSWRALILCIGAITLLSIGYGVSGAVLSPLAEALHRLAPPRAAALWVEGDARRRRRVPCYELGAFVTFGWPVAVPCYCVWSRGRAGWRVAFGLIALIIAPSLIGGICALLFGPALY